MTDFNLIKMYIIFIALIIFFILSFKTLKIQYKDIKKYTWLLLLLIFVLALGIRLSMPHYYKLYMDEPRYAEVAKNIVVHDKAQIQKYYGKEDFQFFEPFHPIAWPFLMSLGFRFFGTNGFVAGYLNSVISSLAVVMMFFFSYLLFKREDVGLWAALLLSLNPLHSYWSTSAGVNAPSLFFMLLSLTAFITYCRTKNIWVHLLATFSFLFSALMRLEYIMLFIPIAFIYLLHWKNVKQELKKVIFWLAWLAMLLFYKVYLTTFLLFMNKLRTNIGAESIVSNTGSFGVSKIASNLGSLLQHILTEYPLMLLLFMFIGIYALFRKKKSILLMLVVWFAVFSAFYMSYAEFQQRHLMFPMLALQLAVAFGISYALKLGQLKKYVHFLKPVLVVLIIVFMAPKLVPLYSINGGDLLQTQVPEIAEQKAPDCYYVASRPALVSSTANLKVIPLDNFLATNTIFAELQDECVLLYKGSYISSSEFSAMGDKYALEEFLDLNSGVTTYSFYTVSAKN